MPNPSHPRFPPLLMFSTAELPLRQKRFSIEFHSRQLYAWCFSVWSCLFGLDLGFFFNLYGVCRGFLYKILWYSCRTTCTLNPGIWRMQTHIPALDEGNKTHAVPTFNCCTGCWNCEQPKKQTDNPNSQIPRCNRKAPGKHRLKGDFDLFYTFTEFH